MRQNGAFSGKKMYEIIESIKMHSNELMQKIFINN